MARRLKTYQTSLGFHDLAIAAPSMKAALDAWGSKSNLFHQGVARESDDPDVVAATMSQPGVVLRRPVGSNGRFSEHAELPKALSGVDTGASAKGSRRKVKAPSPRKIDDETAAAAARRFERAELQRDRERRKEEAARARERERRNRAVAKAQAALEAAEREHRNRSAKIDAERAGVEKRADAEGARWTKLKAKLQAAVRRAHD